MEPREIRIASTRSQKQYKVVTDVTTLMELKELLDNNQDILVKQGDSWVPNTEPVDYTDMTFTEGKTQTNLVSDDSLLPCNFMYKGQMTNSLVILLTNTKKNIKSGDSTRSEVYEAIKEHNLQEAVQAEFGCNYTNVATAALQEFLDTAVMDGDEEEEEEYTSDSPEDAESVCNSALTRSIQTFIRDLYYKDILGEEDIKNIARNIVSMLPDNEEEENKPFDDDVTEMLRSLI